MGHLTVDEIIQFVSMTELNQDTLALSASVNGHIRNCENCIRLVRAFRTVHDAFVRMGAGAQFASAVKERMAERNEMNVTVEEVAQPLNQKEGYR